jgi:hypothetical protein
VWMSSEYELSNLNPRGGVVVKLESRLPLVTSSHVRYDVGLCQNFLQL